MLSWNDEMDIMLAAFDRQAKDSLKNIRMALKRNGLSFNSEFKQYFLRTSSDRIKLSYDQFEMISMFEEHIETDTDTDMSMVDGVRPFHGESNEAGKQMIDSVELIDEKLTTKVPEILEPTSVESLRNFGIQQPTTATIMGGRSGQQGGSDTLVNNYGEGRIGSTIIMKRTINPEISSFDQSHQNGHNGFTDTTEDKLNIRAVIENGKSRKNDAPVGHALLSKHTSPVTSNNQPNVVDDAKNNHDLTLENKITGQSNKRPTTASSTKKSIPSNQMKVKNRFKCQLCNFAGNHKGNFNAHMRSHTGEKPYRCDICRKEFARMEQLKKHKVTHTKQIPFHCRGCFHGFSQKADQKAHEKVCKRRRYECHICKKYASVLKNDMKNHMRKHNGEKPFRCEICMVRFTLKSNLTAHLNNIHTRINP